MTAVGESTYFTLLCPSYHGATMLSALLSNHSQICSAGDGNPGWRDPNRIPCKCGRSIAVCDFWQGLAGLRETGGKPANEHWFPTTPKIIAGSAAGNLRLAKALAVSSFKLKRNLMARLFPQAARRFTDTVSRYAAFCRDYHGAPVFFDGEKSFAKYCSLQACGYPIGGVIHFVRDPRAYAASAKKRGVAANVAAAEWSAYHERLNAMASWGGRTRVLRVRYEDLVAEADRTLGLITGFMGLNPEALTRPPHLDRLHLIGNSLRGFDGVPRQGRGREAALTTPELETVAQSCRALMHKFGYRD